MSTFGAFTLRHQSAICESLTTQQKPFPGADTLAAPRKPGSLGGNVFTWAPRPSHRCHPPSPARWNRSQKLPRRLVPAHFPVSVSVSAPPVQVAATFGFHPPAKRPRRRPPRRRRRRAATRATKSVCPRQLVPHCFTNLGKRDPADPHAHRGLAGGREAGRLTGRSAAAAVRLLCHGRRLPQQIVRRRHSFHQDLTWRLARCAHVFRSVCAASRSPQQQQPPSRSLRSGAEAATTTLSARARWLCG